MPKVAVVGDRDSIGPFRAFGVTARRVTGAEDAKAALEELQREDFALILITEEVAALAEDVLAGLGDRPLPAILIIPSVAGGTGMAFERLRKTVERAVGADILAAREV